MTLISDSYNWERELDVRETLRTFLSFTQLITTLQYLVQYVRNFSLRNHKLFESRSQKCSLNFFESYLQEHGHRPGYENKYIWIRFLDQPVAWLMPLRCYPRPFWSPLFLVPRFCLVHPVADMLCRHAMVWGEITGGFNAQAMDYLQPVPNARAFTAVVLWTKAHIKRLIAHLGREIKPDWVSAGHLWQFFQDSLGLKETYWPQVGAYHSLPQASVDAHSPVDMQSHSPLEHMGLCTGNLLLFSRNKDIQEHLMANSSGYPQV